MSNSMEINPVSKHNKPYVDPFLGGKRFGVSLAFGEGIKHESEEIKKMLIDKQLERAMFDLKERIYKEYEVTNGN